MRLHADTITAGYGAKQVLTGIDISVSSGEFVGLVGPNGCGKSTLLKAMSRILPLVAGAVSIDTIPIWSMSPLELAAQLAFVPQQEPANFDFTVKDVVLMGRYPHLRKGGGYSEKDFSLVNWALDAADIRELADRPITRLSGGEHRRVLLARALAQDTPILLLDEPTAHLDVTHQAELLSLIQKLVRTRKLAALAALHELNHAADYCDRLVLMQSGSVVEEGAPEKVITPGNLLTAYGARARVGRNPVSGRPIILSLSSARESETEQNAPLVHLFCGGGSGIHVFHALLRSGFSVTTGVLNESDNDYETAIALGIETVAEAPFSPISDRAVMEAREIMMRADVVVVSEMPIGTGNLANLLLAEEAQRAGKRVILIGAGEIQERDYTGGAATAAYAELLRHGAMLVRSIEDWIDCM